MGLLGRRLPVKKFSGSKTISQRIKWACDDPDVFVSEDICESGTRLQEAVLHSAFLDYYYTTCCFTQQSIWATLETTFSLCFAIKRNINLLRCEHFHLHIHTYSRRSMVRIETKWACRYFLLNTFPMAALIPFLCTSSGFHTYVFNRPINIFSLNKLCS